MRLPAHGSPILRDLQELTKAEEAHVFGATTLAQPVLLWFFLALPTLLLVHFGADLFGTNFMKIIF